MIKSLNVFCRGYSLTKRPGVRDWNDFLGIEYELRKFQQQAGHISS